MTLVAKPRTPVMKSRFRVEIDGIGDLRLTNAAALKTTFNISETEEGGAQTTAEMTVNGYKYDPLVVERPLTSDTSLIDWVARLKLGFQDKRNGFVYAQDTEGRDIYRWTLEQCIVVDHDEFGGDAKAKEEAMMEKVTIRYLERGTRETL